MKTRLGRFKLKDKELSEVSKPVKTKPKKKADLRFESNLLPDQQQLEDELYYDFRPCCVKVKRLKPKNNQTLKEKDNRDVKSENTIFLAKKNTGSTDIAKSHDRKSDRNCLKQKQPLTGQLPDKELDEELYFDFGPCSVKIQRLQSNVPFVVEKGRKEDPATHGTQDPKSNDQFQGQELDEELYFDFRPCCVKIKRLQSNVPFVVEKGRKEDPATHGTHDPKSNVTSTSTTLSKNANQMENANKDPNMNSNSFYQSRNLRSTAGKSSEQNHHGKLDVRVPIDLRSKFSVMENSHKDSEASAKHDSNLKTSETSSFAVMNIETTVTNAVNQTEKNTSKRYTFRNPKLSLSKRKAQELGLRKSLINDTEETEDNLNISKSSTIFKPTKNSTMHALTFTSPGISCSNSDKISEKSKTNSNQFSQNDPMSSTVKEVSHKGNDKKKKTHTLIYKKANEKKKTKSENRKVLLKRSPKCKRKTTKPTIEDEDDYNERDIYEFLSQSQTSDSDVGKHKDPASDIIKKLIEQGRVVVTKNRKGKPIVVHRKKRNTATLKRNKVPLKKIKPALKFKNQFQPIQDVINEEEEPDHFYDVIEDIAENNEVIPVSEISKESDNAVARISNSFIVPADQGTFSNLARSVLMQQTNQKSSALKGATDKKRILEITQKNISTPFQRSRSSLLTDGANLSPIPKFTTPLWDISLRNPSRKSINFEHNVSYTPSFHDILDLPQIQSNSYFPSESINRTTPETTQSSSSSFSSNHSNAENMPPPARIQPRESNDENNVIFNIRQTLNPRRSIRNRSPLKTINIIDVITLPPYRGPMIKDKDKANKNHEYHELSALQESSKEDQNDLDEKSKSPLKTINILDVRTLPPYTGPMIKDKDKANKNHEYHELSALQESSKEDQNDLDEKSKSPLKTINILDVRKLPPYRGPMIKDKDKANKNHEYHELSALQESSKEDQNDLDETSKSQNENTQALFGFEEYLNEDQDCLHEKSDNNITQLDTLSLHKRLKKLKKWRPNVLTRYKDTKSSTITKNIFDDEFDKKKGHCDIRNLLCSTMINQPSKKIQGATTETLLISSGDDSDDVLSRTSNDLFGDPESTLDAKSIHRTYERPFRRKRKLAHQYSVVLDSEDEIEDENDHNTSVTNKAKRLKKNQNRHEKSPDPELDKFVTEFNSILKEAEEYELIIE